MRLLVAVDTITTLDIVLNAIEARSWPKGTEAHVLSVVEDDTIPAATWRTEGYGLNAVRHEMRRRGEQVSALAIEHLRAMGITAQVTIMRGDPAFLIPFAARKRAAGWIFETGCSVAWQSQWSSRLIVQLKSFARQPRRSRAQRAVA